MSAFDGLPRTKFGDIQFPGEIHRLRSVFRHHVFEYPHSPGGAIEKLGRGLWQCTVRGNFQATFPGYPDLYPNSMATLRGYYGLGATLNFTHPTLGTFPAMITSWDQVKDAKIRSGEKVDIEFLEDQDASFSVTETLVSADYTAIGPSAQQLAAELAAIRGDLTLSQNDLSLFDAIQSTVNSVLALKDTANLYGNLYAAKVLQVVSLCQQLDVSQNMQDARAWPLVDAMQVVWQNAIRIEQDLQAQRAQLSDYTVPFAMPLLQVAINLYGDASRQEDLLALNSDRIDNPISIRAGTDIRYYPPTPQDQIAQLST